MKKTALLCFALLLTFAARPPAAAAEKEGGGGDLKATLGVEAGRLAGWTRYRITVPAAEGLVESELEWSLDSWLAGVRASLEGKERWFLHFSLFTNLSGGSGPMEDLDWVDGELIISSTSEVEADAFSAVILELAGRYDFLRRPKWTLGGTAGLLYRYFDLTAADLVQRSPAGQREYDVAVAGPVVAYHVSYAVPYAGAALLLAPSPRVQVTLEALAGYATAADEDDHLLRFKLAEGEADGLALMGRASAAFAVTPRWSLTVSLEALSVETSGEQKQNFYGGASRGTVFEGIADEIDTGQVRLTAGGSYRF